MRQCFVIMAFGRLDTERAWREVYEPAAAECGMQAVRVDRDDDGTLLPLQITEWLNNATFIIGDLTYERPNCYLEVGFAMGLNRYDSLVLACRADHNLHAQNRTTDSPKVHFDLQSFGILWWESSSLPEFKSLLVDKMRRRLAAMPKPIRAGTRRRRASAAAAKKPKSIAVLNRLFKEHERD